MNDIYIGQKYGRLTIIEFSHKVGYSKVYKCLCECGKTKNIYLGNVRQGKTTSCGCHQKQIVKSVSKKHGCRHKRIYSIWTNMKSRCYNEKTPNFIDYGYRGISICDEWKNNFQSFYDWALKNEYNDFLTIERIDCNGDYEPSNCKWIEMKFQSRNRRGNRFITLDGVTKTLKEWCNDKGINYKTVHTRISRGMSEIDALYYGMGR